MAQRDPQGVQSGESRSRGLLVPLAGLATGVALLVLSLVIFLYAQIYAPGSQPATEVTFQHGTSVTAIARTLEQQHVVRSAFFFRVMAKMRGKTTAFQAGTYDFPARASTMDVLSQIEQGKVVRFLVTIPEGKTSAQAVRILMAAPNLTGDIDVPPEGALLPETYQYERGETRQAVLDRMLEAGRKTLAGLWATRQPGLPYATKQDALIMASIVERETALPSERPRIAAVFINRLRQNMRLGSDPTVIYGVSRGEPLGRGLTRTELDTWTPWNTYLIDKLPLTPIANPGKASLAAVLNPAKTNDLYFVADGTGGHVFAATYEEHLANVARWRSIEGDVEHYTTSADPADGAAMAATASVQPQVSTQPVKPVSAIRLKAVR